MAIEDLVEEAHATATDAEFSEVASELQRVLGQKLVAFAIGDRHPKTIGRYARGERQPDDEAGPRLVNLFTVVTMLRNAMTDRAVKSWMMGMNPRLEGAAPIEVFHDDRPFEVMGAAKAYLARR